MDAPPFHKTSPRFGTLLREYRQAAGLTQAALAERAGLSLRGVSDLERGARQVPRIETLRMLAEGLGFGPGTSEWASLLAARNTAGAMEPRRAPSRLPISPTPIIGREREVASIIRLLDDQAVRLLTLVGPGGIGKTRLALAVARRLVDRFPDGVIFTDLTPVRDPALVLPTIANALGVRDIGTGSLAGEVIGAINDQQLLLVLDNIEQVVAAAPEIASILDACPHLTILATGRVALRISAEHIYPLGTLELPEEDSSPTLAALTTIPAVALFIARAQAMDPGFDLTDANARPIARLVRRLEGVPLAIELAAARIRALPVEALIDRLDRQLPLLTGGLRDAPERHQTMRDTIAWSYDLLRPDEQSMFRRLSVFVGGFTLEATESVAGADSGPDSFDRLAGLMEASLVGRDRDSGSASRYRMLETVREFGLEQLSEHGEEVEVRDAHARYFLTHVLTHETAVNTANDATHAHTEAERDNLRVALVWLTDRQRIDEALRFAVAIWPFRTNHAHDMEARSTIEALLSHPANMGTPGSRAPALLTICHLARRQGDMERALRAGEEAVALFQQAHDHANASQARISLGWALMDVGRHGDAIEQFRTARDLATINVDDESIAVSHDLIGWIHLNRNDFALADTHMRQALEISRRIGNRWHVANVHGHLAILSARQGHVTQGTERYSEAIAIAREIGDHHILGSALVLSADLVRRTGDLMAAEATVEEAYDICDRNGYRHGVAFALFARGRLASDRGWRSAALDFQRQSTLMFQRIGLRYGMQYCAVHPFDALACLAFERGALAHAARLLGIADALLATNNLPRPQGVPHYFERHEIDRIRQALETPELADEWGRAQALSDDEMVAAAFAFSLT